MEFSVTFDFEDSFLPCADKLPSLVVDGKLTIRHLKDSIWKRTIIPVRCQRLYVKKSAAENCSLAGSLEKLELSDDTKSLSHYGVNANNSIIEVVAESIISLKVKKLNGVETFYYAHPNDLISQLKESIYVIENKAPFPINLMLKTEVLADSKRLFEYGIGEDDVLHMVHVSSPTGDSASDSTLALEEITAKPIAVKKPFHCAFEDCLERYAKFIGDCHYCSAKFCSRHRLPELHLCSNLQTCKKQSFESNQSKVMQGKCIASKLI